MASPESSTTLVEAQGCILTLLIAMIPVAFLIPPGPFDSIQCSFLNVSNIASISLDGSANGSSAAVEISQLLCIHANGVSIYTVGNSSAQQPLADMKAMGPDLSGAHEQVMGAMSVVRWVFIVLIPMFSIWWIVFWMSSYKKAGSWWKVGAWALWFVSLAGAGGNIIASFIGREIMKRVPWPEGNTTISYGSHFFACLLMLLVLLGVFIWQFPWKRIRSSPRYVPYSHTRPGRPPASESRGPVR